MRPWAVSFLLLGIFAVSVQAESTANFTNTLMPQPAHFSEETGELKLTPAFTAVVDRFHDARLDEALGRSLLRLQFQTGLQIATAPARGSAGTLTITVDGPGETVQALDEDESYSLQVNGNGAHLQARTDVGAMRGLETFLQLVQSGGSGFFVPSISIQDTPRFRWRGLMVDFSRHFEPVGVIKRTLDGMAAVKLNVFHWHLTDDQGFRIESKIYPKLTGMGSDGCSIPRTRRGRSSPMRGPAAFAWCRNSIYPAMLNPGWWAIPNWPAGRGTTSFHLSASMGSLTQSWTPHAAAPMNLSTGSSVRWPGSFPTPICTSAVTKITGCSGAKPAHSGIREGAQSERHRGAADLF